MPPAHLALTVTRLNDMFLVRPRLVSENYLWEILSLNTTTPRVLSLNLDAVKGLLVGFITIKNFSDRNGRKQIYEKPH